MFKLSPTFTMIDKLILQKKKKKKEDKLNSLILFFI